MRHKRNEPCPCGSGKKYKVCCANKRTSSQGLALASVAIFGALAVWVVAGVFRQGIAPPPGKVWSEEHGHWHDAAVPGLERPPGPAPPGKVWNEEHGHWHDADSAEPAGGFQLPAEDPEDARTELPEADASYSEVEP